MGLVVTRLAHAVKMVYVRMVSMETVLVYPAQAVFLDQTVIKLVLAVQTESVLVESMGPVYASVVLADIMDLIA